MLKPESLAEEYFSGKDFVRGKLEDRSSRLAISMTPLVLAWWDDDNRSPRGNETQTKGKNCKFSDFIGN